MTQLVGLILPPRDTEVGRSRAITASSSRCSPQCCASASSIWPASRRRCRAERRRNARCRGLDSWLELMRGIKSGLVMLGKTRAVEVIEGISTQLKRVMQPGSRARQRYAGSAGRRDRQHRVLHGDAAGRARRSLVHARQRPGLPGSPSSRKKPPHPRPCRRSSRAPTRSTLRSPATCRSARRPVIRIWRRSTPPPRR